MTLAVFSYRSSSEKALTSNLVHQLKGHELVVDIEHKRRSHLIDFLCEIVSFQLVQYLVRSAHVVLVDWVGENPSVVVGSLVVVSGLSEGVELLVEEVLHVHFDTSVHSGFLQVTSRLSTNLTLRSRKLRNRLPRRLPEGF